MKLSLVIFCHLCRVESIEFEDRHSQFLPQLIDQEAAVEDGQSDLEAVQPGLFQGDRWQRLGRRKGDAASQRKASPSLREEEVLPLAAFGFSYLR